jgi:hypothetical protein
MIKAWEETAKAAGFRKAFEITTSNMATPEKARPWRIVGSPVMPEGHIALVGDRNAVILGPNGIAYSVGWDLATQYP